MSTLTVVLAAGRGSRFHGPGHKLNQPLGDTTVAAHTITHAVEAQIGPVIVITGATALDSVPEGVTMIENPRWADGQATSLATALDAARAREVSAIVVGLADQPFIPPSAWRAVAAATSPIAVATYDGQRANPVRLAAEIWPLLPTSGDTGARDLIRLRRKLVQRVPCEGRSADIDTWEDLLRWQRKSSTSSP